MPTIECVTETGRIANCAPGCCTPQDIWDPNSDSLASCRNAIDEIDSHSRDE